MSPLFYKMLAKTVLHNNNKQKCPKCSLEQEVTPNKETKCARCGVMLPKAAK